MKASGLSFCSVACRHFSLVFVLLLGFCVAGSAIAQVDNDNLNDSGETDDTASLLMLIAVIKSASTQNAVNGLSVEQVFFGRDGEQLGGYFRIGPGEWKETNLSGETLFSFYEIDRDENTVYLRDSSRNVTIRLDMDRQKVVYSDADSEPFDLYDVQRSALVNGYVVTGAEFGRDGTFMGRYRQTEASSWSELNVAGETLFSFVETGRDDWSVYLHDLSRDVYIQLDTYRNKVVYSDAESHFDLYDILDTETPADNPFPTADANSPIIAEAEYFFLQTLESRRHRTCLEGNERRTGSAYEGFSFMAECALVTGQLWQFVDLTSKGYPGYYQITTLGQADRGFCLESGFYNTASESGLAAHMADCPDGILYTGQMWKKIPTPEGFRLQSLYREPQNQCLTGNKVSSAGPLNGTTHMDECADASDQVWLAVRQSDYGSIPEAEAAIPPDFSSVVNGLDVEQVYFGREGAQYGGYFRIGPDTWKETDSNGASVATFTEQNRDDWSVYLYDGNREVSIQLDLFRGKVIYSDSGTARFDLYDIQRSSRVSGYTGQQAYFGQGGTFLGGYFQTGPGSWKEVDANGSTSHTFNEANRDDWSIYLHDPGRNVDIQIDLFRNKIVYSDASNAGFDLYDVQSAVNVNGLTVQRATFGRNGDQFGTFSQTSAGRWKETNVQGELRFEFDEVGRDDWSVYLLDSSRGVTIQIDLYRGMIIYDDSTTDPFDLYEIIRPSEIGGEVNQVAYDYSRIAFVGSRETYSPDEFRAELVAVGFELVDSPQVEKGQCSLLYASADRSDISAEAGVLMCNIPLDDGGSRISAQAVYGGCDVANPLNQGVGSSCTVGVAAAEGRFRVSQDPPVYTNMRVTGPEASQCTGISTEHTCAGASADLVSTSYKVVNENGTGIGLSASVGVGAGLSGGYEDGTLHFSITGKLLVGGSVDVSISGQDVVYVYRLGETAWLEHNDEIIAVGNRGLEAFVSLGVDVRDAGDQVIVELENGGQTVIGFAQDTAKDIEEGTVATYNDARNTLDTVANQVAQTGETVVVTPVKKVLTFLGL